MAIVTQHRSHRSLCPAIAYASLALRILSYKGTSMTTSINTARIGDKLIGITSNDILHKLRQTVKNIGLAELGFHPHEIGTHSIRSSTAMQLFLAKIPTYTIMLLGRWSSDAFLRYLRRQVLEFSRGLSEVMNENEFYTIPEIERVNPEDPQTRNTASFASAAGSGPTIVGARFPRPAVSTWS